MWTLFISWTATLLLASVFSDMVQIPSTRDIWYWEGREIAIQMSVYSYNARTWLIEGGYASHLVVFLWGVRVTNWVLNLSIWFVSQPVDVR